MPKPRPALQPGAPRFRDEVRLGLPVLLVLATWPALAALLLSVLRAPPETTPPAPEPVGSGVIAYLPARQGEPARFRVGIVPGARWDIASSVEATAGAGALRAWVATSVRPQGPAAQSSGTGEVVVVSEVRPQPVTGSCPPVFGARSAQPAPPAPAVRLRVVPDAALAAAGLEVPPLPPGSGLTNAAWSVAAWLDLEPDGGVRAVFLEPGGDPARIRNAVERWLGRARAPAAKGPRAGWIRVEQRLP